MTAVAIVLLIVPGMVNATVDLRRIYDKRDRGYELTRDEVAALADLRSDRRAGGVVAPLPMASAIPEVTGDTSYDVTSIVRDEAGDDVARAVVTWKLGLKTK